MSATWTRESLSSGSSMIPGTSVMEIRHSAPIAPEICAAMVSALMLYTFPSASQPTLLTTGI